MIFFLDFSLFPGTSQIYIPMRNLPPISNVLPCLVFPSDGRGHGQYRQSECSSHPPADDCCALQNSHSGMQIAAKCYCCFCFSPLILIFPIILKTQQHKFVNWQCDMEYRGSDFTSAVTLGNPDVLLGSGLLNSKIFQIQQTHLTHLFVHIGTQKAEELHPLQGDLSEAARCWEISVVICMGFTLRYTSVHNAANLASC